MYNFMIMCIFGVINMKKMWNLFLSVLSDKRDTRQYLLTAFGYEEIPS